jgi:membrane-associated PAP2 superfamily phosphatase
MIDHLPQTVQRSLLVLVIVVCFFEFSGVDMLVQRGFFDAGMGQWLIERDSQPWRFLMYDGIKKVFLVLTLGLFLAVTLAHQKVAWIRQHRRPLVVVLLTMILVPVVVNFLKWYTDIPCPRDIRPFGGSVPYVTLFEHYPEWFLHDSSLRCYPAGHASGGFALMSLFFLFKQRRYQYLGLAIGLTLGWTTGLYKMAIGDHFLSHTVVSMLIAWIVACMTAYFILRDKRLDPMAETESEETAVWQSAND